jgi:carbamoyltransferase
MTTILGVGGFFHDFNAGVITIDEQNKVQVYAAEEERYSRKKHHTIMGATSSSIHSIEKCLLEAGQRNADVDYLIFSDTEIHPLKAFLIDLFPGAEVHHLAHHVCHAAAAFYSYDMADAAILCLDGFGDGKSGLFAHGKGNQIEPLFFPSIEDSIGLEYLRVTYQIGLGSFGAEGKTQGLAAYGEPAFYEAYMNEITLNSNEFITLSKKLRKMEGYLAGEHYIETKSLFNDFLLKNITRRFKDEPLQKEHMDMAASIQKVLNEVGLHAARTIKKRTGSRNLVLTGGVALNSTMNGILLKSGLFDEVVAHPSASDRGNGLGAALYFLTNELNVDSPLSSPLIYGGRSFTDQEIESVLLKNGTTFDMVEQPSQVAAEFIAENKIVGWFQGGSEMGARALGNRSILANPHYADNKDILNAKVKHREYFRPFAPAVLAERAGEYFDTDRELAHMTMTVDVIEAKRSEIPVATHEDGTARIQTVSREENPKFYDVIETFGKLTGTPVIINTSFNDNLEPIVESPDDALNCFNNTGMEVLVMGDYVVMK